MTLQATARAMRPPSSGNAGTRLNRNRTALISASQLSNSRAGVTSALLLRIRASQNSCPPAVSAPIPTHRPTTSRVTAGPAAATLNSAPGESVSRLMRAMPPKNHRSMLSVSMPSRRAASACPNSWRIRETKNSSALATAVA